MLHLVKTTGNTAVRHSKFLSVQDAHEQNVQFHSRYTAKQHAQVRRLARVLQAQYPDKRVYINARATTLSATVSKTTHVSNRLLVIAREFGARVKLTQTAVILHTV
jgi:hypothetical protein